MNDGEAKDWMGSEGEAVVRRMQNECRPGLRDELEDNLQAVSMYIAAAITAAVADERDRCSVTAVPNALRSFGVIRICLDCGECHLSPEALAAALADAESKREEALRSPLAAAAYSAVMKTRPHPKPCPTCLAASFRTLVDSDSV